MNKEEFTESRQVSHGDITHQIVNCFNLCSSLTRDCQALGGELRNLHSLLDQHFVKANHQMQELSSTHRQVLECLLHVKEHIDTVLTPSPEKVIPSPLDKALQVVKVTVDNCLTAQAVKTMDDPVGQMIRAGYHTTEGTRPVPHNSPSGTILSVLRPGYIQEHGETRIVIRPSVVQVSAGPVDMLK